MQKGTKKKKRAAKRTAGAVAKRAAKRPSAAALREMPEMDFSRAERRPEIAERIRAAGGYFIPDGKGGEMFVQVGRRRPAKDIQTAPSKTHSVRLPDPVWDELERTAGERRTTTHALLRELVINGLRDLRGAA